MVESLKTSKEGMLAAGTQILNSTNTNIPSDFRVSDFPSLGWDAYSYENSRITNKGENGTYLYNYHAAVLYPEGATVRITSPITQSICPSNWQLPNGTGDRSWDKLLRYGQGGYNIITSDDHFVTGVEKTILQESPLSFVASGTGWNGGDPDADGRSVYWSHTPGSYDYTVLVMAAYKPNQNLVILKADYAKAGGFAIRCVATP